MLIASLHIGHFCVSNPCRCPKKAKALKQMGMLNEQKMEFNIATRTRIMDYVETEYENLRLSIEDKYTELYRIHPAKDDFEKETIIDEILEDELIMKHLNMN